MTLNDIKELCAEYGFADNGGYDALRYWLRERLDTADTHDSGCGGYCTGCDERDNTISALEQQRDELEARIRRMTEGQAPTTAGASE